jgi:hypothetical protein
MKIATKEVRDIYELREVFEPLNKTSHVIRYSPELHTFYVGRDNSSTKAMLDQDLGHEEGQLVFAQRKHASFPVKITIEQQQQ